MLLVTPGIHPERGIAKAGRGPRPLHFFRKKSGKQGQTSKRMGESTRAQVEAARAQAEAARDAAAREHAVDVDSEDEGVMGGAPVRGMLDAASQLTFADLSEDSDDE